MKATKKNSVTSLSHILDFKLTKKINLISYLGRCHEKVVLHGFQSGRPLIKKKLKTARRTETATAKRKQQFHKQCPKRPPKLVSKRTERKITRKLKRDSKTSASNMAGITVILKLAMKLNC